MDSSKFIALHTTFSHAPLAVGSWKSSTLIRLDKVSKSNFLFVFSIRCLWMQFLTSFRHSQVYCCFSLLDACFRTAPWELPVLTESVGGEFQFFLKHKTFSLPPKLIYFWCKQFKIFSCPICQQNPMIIPVQTNCYHVYCYCCLYDYLVQKSGRHCQICHQQIISCRPLQMDKNH